MAPHEARRHSPHRSPPPVAAAPASAASHPGGAGGPRRLDDRRRRTRPRQHAPLPALSPRAGFAGHVERSRHVDRGPHATRRQAVRLTRWPPRPQPSWPAMPLMSLLWPGLNWVWRGTPGRYAGARLAGRLSGVAWCRSAAYEDSVGELLCSERPCRKGCGTSLERSVQRTWRP
jgi:hypothetical protein